MSVETKTVDGVPFARKYFENNERYIEALIVIKEDGTQDLVETERLIDEYYYNETTSFIVKETTVHPYCKIEDVGEI